MGRDVPRERADPAVIPVVPTDAQRAYWRHVEGCEHHSVVIGGPTEGPEVIPCPALIAPMGLDGPPGCPITHVAYELDEIEVAALARGGTLWLTTWGGLPIHELRVTLLPDDGRMDTT
jgi:hypothetical protein